MYNCFCRILQVYDLIEFTSMHACQTETQVLSSRRSARQAECSQWEIVAYFGRFDRPNGNGA